MKLDEMDCAAKLDRAEFEFEASMRMVRPTPVCLRAVAAGYIYARLGQRRGRKGGSPFIASDLSVAQFNTLLTELIGSVPIDEPRPPNRRVPRAESLCDSMSDAQLIRCLIQPPEISETMEDEPC